MAHHLYHHPLQEYKFLFYSKSTQPAGSGGNASDLYSKRLQFVFYMGHNDYLDLGSLWLSSLPPSARIVPQIGPQHYSQIIFSATTCPELPIATLIKPHE
jgi:hypothetical protein